MYIKMMVPDSRREARSFHYSYFLWSDIWKAVVVLIVRVGNNGPDIQKCKRKL